MPWELKPGGDKSCVDGRHCKAPNKCWWPDIFAEPPQCWPPWLNPNSPEPNHVQMDTPIYYITIAVYFLAGLTVAGGICALVFFLRRRREHRIDVNPDMALHNLRVSLGHLERQVLAREEQRDRAARQREAHRDSQLLQRFRHYSMRLRRSLASAAGFGELRAFFLFLDSEYCIFRTPYFCWLSRPARLCCAPWCWP